MAVSILLVAGNSADTTRAADALARAGYRVEVASDASSGGAKLARTAFDVVVVDWVLSDADGPAFVRQFRPLQPRTPFILLSALTGPMARRHAEKVGAVDLVSKPVTAGMLVRAVSAAVGRAPPPAEPAVLEPAPMSSKRAPDSPLASNASTAPLLRARGWLNAVETIRLTLSSNLGVEAAIAATANDSGDLHASLSMIAAEQLVEIGLALVVNRASGVALANRILRSTTGDDATIRELLTELCNSVLGALKAEMRESGFSFTIGLPKIASAPAAAVRAAFSGNTVTSFTAGDCEVGAILGARQSIPVAVMVSRLEEGNVIAEDVYVGSNTLMLSAGTRLTATTIQRLVRQLPNRTVRVCKML